jgi:PIN domain nuclease of toxin-antitoxin system
LVKNEDTSRHARVPVMDDAQDKLSPLVRQAVLETDHDIAVSVVSVWEIVIKQAVGKLTIKKPLRDILAEQQRDNGLHILPVTLDHVLAVEDVPLHHKDPFDRLLIAQAIFEDATADPAFADYPVRVLW